MKLISGSTRAILILIALVTFTFTSCEKEQSGSEQEEMEASQASAESSGEAENIFSQVFDDAYGANNEVGLEGSGVFWGRTDSLSPVQRCFTVTVIRLNPPNAFPVKIILDFGNGCVGPDGHTRRGKIITTYTGRLIHVGSVAETTFDNFFIDNVKVEGVHRIENITPPAMVALHARKFKVDVINGKLLKPNGNYVHWNSHKTKTQIDGMATPFIPHDDAFKIEGQATGTTKRGTLIVAWQSTIVEPLIRRLSCRWIVRGRIRTVRANTATTNTSVAILDFGNGVCDNLATLTINGTTHIITLP
jgi:hypothetical protein